MSFTQKSETFRHTLSITHDITVYYRSCDFCPVLTPLPPPEVLDYALTVRNYTVKPCIEFRFVGFGVEDIEYDPFRLKAVRFRPLGWELFGEKWVCPGCVKLTQSCLGQT